MAKRTPQVAVLPDDATPIIYEPRTQLEAAYRRGRELYPNMDLKRGEFIRESLGEPCSACFVAFVLLGSGYTPEQIMEMPGTEESPSLKLHEIFPDDISLDKCTWVFRDFDTKYDEFQILDRVDAGVYRGSLDAA